MEETVTYENEATNISVKLSSSYTTKFKYDEETGRYTRYFREDIRKDYNTGEAVTVKNFNAHVDTEKCTGCGKCNEACPVGCIDILNL